MRSDQSDTPLRVPGFPIRTSTDRSLVGSSPWLIAASRVLLRLQAPRHPPLTLYNLENIDARARYGILKVRTAHCSRPPKPQNRPTTGREQRGRAASNRYESEAGVAWRDGIASGCLKDRNPRVTPSKRNSDAHCHP